MRNKIRREIFEATGFYRLGFALFLSLCLSAAAFGQTTDNAQAAVKPAAVEKSAASVPTPVMQDYKGIKIGMAADEVRSKLGEPKTENKNSFTYDFSDAESAQIALDADQKVRMIAVMYLDDIENAPKYREVLGGEAKDATDPDGSIYKLIEYPQAGYWVAYSRTAGENPIVTVTMQKMRAAK